LKANQSTTYTKTVVDTALGLQAIQSTTYTKSDVDPALSLKSDRTYVYAQLALKCQPINYIRHNASR
ncbi:MAG: hypothetical protein ACKPKO_23650, partial [Candidatus Fonsibacter sp.]